MSTIKFGTDGWRAIIADDFTIENLRRVAKATALWMQQDYPGKPVVIGYDCRFGGEMFSEVAARVFVAHGIKVILSNAFASTPMISYATIKLGAGAGIVITASHNPPSYNGFKIKGYYGGPALPEMISAVEALLPDIYNDELPTLASAPHLVEVVELEALYIEHATKSFDLEAIKKSGIRIAFDSMYGAGRLVVNKLLPEVTTLHGDNNPGFNGQAPEPILKNLSELQQLLSSTGAYDFAFATDGDADRIGVLDRKGNFIDSHHIILMLINYLKGHKNMSGEVVNSFSCTARIANMCQHYAIGNTVTKIGFKYICGYMVEGEVLVGGEESGGIAIAGHIPERDGVWIALTLLEYLAISGKTLEELIQEVYSITGAFALERYDLHVTEEKKASILEQLKENPMVQFGSYAVQRVEDMDGYKLHVSNEDWVMVRASGTEPVIRVYAEAGTSEKAFELLDSFKATFFDN